MGATRYQCFDVGRIPQPLTCALGAQASSRRQNDVAMLDPPASTSVISPHAAQRLMARTDFMPAPAWTLAPG
jgi:hypothetical protein